MDLQHPLVECPHRPRKSAKGFASPPCCFKARRSLTMARFLVAWDDLARKLLTASAVVGATVGVSASQTGQGFTQVVSGPGYTGSDLAAPPWIQPTTSHNYHRTSTESKKSKYGMTLDSSPLFSRQANRLITKRPRDRRQMDLRSLIFRKQQFDPSDDVGMSRSSSEPAGGRSQTPERCMLSMARESGTPLSRVPGGTARKHMSRDVVLAIFAGLPAEACSFVQCDHCVAVQGTLGRTSARPPGGGSSVSQPGGD